MSEKQTDAPEEAKPKKPSSDLKEARRAAALKRNLGRRKAAKD
ncbi:MAG: hypothetical protein ABW199_10190 [Caulobacterales bacterium]